MTFEIRVVAQTTAGQTQNVRTDETDNGVVVGRCSIPERVLECRSLSFGPLFL